MSRKRVPKKAANKGEVLFVRMTKPDRQLVTAVSKRKGLSASAYARMAILDRIRIDQGSA